MAEPLRCVKPETIVTGWDFSTGAVKCLAFDLDGKSVAEVRLPWKPLDRRRRVELNLMQLEGQARATRAFIWPVVSEAGPSALGCRWHLGRTTPPAASTPTASGSSRVCWNDHSLADYHSEGLQRLGGQDRVRDLIGGPWAIRYVEPFRQRRGSAGCRRLEAHGSRLAARSTRSRLSHGQLRRRESVGGRLDWHHGPSLGAMVPADTECARK